MSYLVFEGVCYIGNCPIYVSEGPWSEAYGSLVVNALCYKPEGCGFRTQ
jgi:hypothetical protein